MESSVTVLRVRGIAIGIHWNWLLVFGIVVWSLARSLFPATYPGLDGATYVAMAVVAALLFFGSILLHELGHALRAQREGIPIRRITLWLLGGVAHLEQLPPSPGAEFRVAILGPATSAVLAAAFGLAAWLGNWVDAPATIQGVIDYVARMNVVVLLFNLIPALPLDGGRVLRAWLWRRQQSFIAATKSAGRASRIFGFMLVAVGLLNLFAGAGLGGIWLVFLGWFLLQAAQGENELADAGRALGLGRVGDVMTTRPAVLRSTQTVADLLDGPAGSPLSFPAYPVMDDGRLVGVASVRAAATVPPEARRFQRVSDVMVPLRDVETVRPGQSLLEVLPMFEGGNGRTLVTDGDDRLVGVLSRSDVSRAVEGVRRTDARGPARRAGVLVWLIVGAIFLVAAASLYHPPYVVISPGDSFDIAGDVSISGVAVTPVRGAYLLASVRVSQPSALRLAVTALREDREIVPLGDVLPPDVSPGEYARAAKEEFRESQLMATAAAARALGMPVTVAGDGARVSQVVRGAPAAKVLEPGDVIVAVDGQPVTQAQTVGEVVRARPPGSELRFTVLRDGKPVDATIRSERLPRVSGGVGIGIVVETHGLKVDLPFTVTFKDRPDVGGPSAGLAYALAVSDMLAPADYAGGRRVAATGTIDPEGDVGPVGGVKEKAVAVERADADVFIVPANEVDAARRRGLPVFGVERLERALATLAPLAAAA